MSIGGSPITCTQTNRGKGMSIQRTPGPWHVNAMKNGRIIGDETTRGYDKLQISSANATVATVYRGRDARLIALAPDLLKVCQDILVYLTRGDDGLYSGELSLDLYTALRQIVARATGAW